MKTSEAIKMAQAEYEAVYTYQWNTLKGTSPIRIVQHESPLNDNSPIVKVYENEGNFFGCGFNWLHFSGKGNAGLKPALIKAGYDVRKDYPSGFYFRFKNIELHGHGAGNGDFPIQETAYHAGAKLFRELTGYDVYPMSRLD